MKHIALLFLFIPTFLFAQYPETGNKQRLGYQTTGDGLVWRGVAGDTVRKPNHIKYAYFVMDTVGAVLYRYIKTKQQWQPVASNPDLSGYLEISDTAAMLLPYFKKEGGRLTGTAGAGFVGFPLQSGVPTTPANGFSIFGDNVGRFSWIQTDGFFRSFVSRNSIADRRYTFQDKSYTLADSADVAALPTGSGTTNYIPKWTSANVLGNSNLFDNGTYVGVLNSKPWQWGQWTDAGRPTGVTGYTGYNTTGNGIEWYQGSRWAKVPEFTFNRGTAGRIPYPDANGQYTESSLLTWNGVSLILNANIFSSTAKLIASSNGTNNNSETAIEIVNSATNVSGRGQIVAGNIGVTSPYLAIKSRQTNSPNALTERMRFNGDETISMYNNTNVTGNLTATGNVGVGTTTFGSIISGSAGVEVIKQDAQATYIAAAYDNSGTFPNTSLGSGFVMAKARGTIASPSSVAIGDRSAYFLNANYAGSWQNTAGISFYIDGAVSSGVAPTQIRFETGTSTAGRATRMSILSSGLIGVGTSSPQRLLHVAGEARITDLTTDTPTRIVGADADGDLGAITVGTGLGLSSGTLSYTGVTDNIYTANGTLTGNRTLNGLGYTLRFNANTIVEDSLRVVDLPNHSNPDSIVTTVGGVLGKRKWMMPAANAYDGTSTGYFHDGNALGFQTSGDNFYHLDYADTTGYWEKGSYGSNGLDYSGTYGAQVGSFSYARLYARGGSKINFIQSSTVEGFSVFQQSLPGALIEQFSIDSLSTMSVFGYGTGAKEAADLSKTESVYDAVYMTDGTVGERHSKVERYATITSTSSPQTLSSDYSDNLINQGGTQATFTLNMPASPVDGQVCTITYNNAITTLTIDGNGETIVGSAVVTGVPGSQRKFKFYSGIGWIKIY